MLCIVTHPAAVQLRTDNQVFMTTPDLQPYNGVIERLKPLFHNSDFNEVFAILTADIPKPKQFLIKMELKRLATPCNYYIDLRGKVDGEVRPYEHDGKTHYMDDMAIRTFEKGLKRYGKYTLGLYEEVTNTDNNYRVRHKQVTQKRVEAVIAGNTNITSAVVATEETEEKRGPQLVPFASYSIRSEERMNFTIDVELDLPDGEQCLGSTVDISVSGCKLKIPANRRVSQGQQFAIHFRGLEQEFALGFSHGVPYEVLSEEIIERYQYIRAKRLAMDDEHGFSDFLRQFIHGNKRRYKVNLDNTLEAVIIKGYEQFYLPRLSALPLFINVSDGAALVRMALSTENNRHILHYFLDERQQSVLPQIIHPRRLQQCLQKKPAERSTILYSFTHAAKGKLFYYSATMDELWQQPELQSVFLGFGAKKESWRIYHLQVQRAHPSDAHMPLSLPESADGDIAALNQPPSTLVTTMIKDIKYIATLTDITAQESRGWYQQMPFDEAALGELRRFGHAKLEQMPPLENVAIQYVNLRAEGRYLYKTKVIFHINQNLSIEGFSRDFSCRGLQVESPEPLAYEKGDVLNISLPDMQKISSKFNLQGLPYEVMAISKSKMIMNLRIIERDKPHQGRLFFEVLIQNNRAKLNLAEETPKFPGLSQALRNMYVRSCNAFPFYIHRQGIRYELNVVGRGAELHSLHHLLQLFAEKPHDINLLPFVKSQATNLQFANQLKQMKRQDPPRSYEVFMRFRPGHKTVDSSFITEFDYDLKTPQARHFFVQDAIANDIFFCFRIFLSRTGRPDTEHIAKELGYISQYAIHKAKILEEELWSVVGVGDVIDISLETLLRFGIPQQSIMQQLEKKQRFFASRLQLRAGEGS